VDKYAQHIVLIDKIRLLFFQRWKKVRIKVEKSTHQGGKKYAGEKKLSTETT